MKPLHLAALWAFAFVQPLFDLLGREAEFFVARGNTTADIVLFALAFTFVPPALMGLVVWLLGRVRPVLGDTLQLTLVGLLVAAIVLPPAGDLLGGSGFSVAVAAVAGAAAALLYARAAAVQTLMTVLAPAPLLFLVLFLAVSPASELVLPSGGSEAVTSPAQSDTPVVMVIFDELPLTSLLDARDRIDARRYPGFASVAADATWYRDATTVAGHTTQAVPALLTGRRPRGELPIARDHPRSLFTLLARSHRLEVVEPVTDVCPRDLCRELRLPMAHRLRALASDLRVVSAHLLLPEDLRGGLPPVDRDWQGFDDERGAAPDTAAEQRKAVRKAIFERHLKDDPSPHFARIMRAVGRRGSRPPLLFLHTSLPHRIWRFLPDGRRYVVPGRATPGLGTDRWEGPQWQVDQSFQRHLLQTQYADRLLARLLERLRASGLYEEAIVVVTADHGGSFRAGDRRRVPTPTNLPDVANVPLLIKSPGQRAGRVVSGAVRSIDVLPTIARELGVRLSGVDGVPVGERGSDLATRIDVPHADDEGATESFATLLRERRKRRGYERSILGAARYDPYAMGPRPELIGRRLGSSAVGKGRVRLDAAVDYRPGSPVVPAYVSGVVTGLADGAELAVAVNGRVEATTRVDGSAKPARFGALVPPRALRPGANRVGVFEVTPAGELLALL